MLVRCCSYHYCDGLEGQHFQELSVTPILHALRTDSLSRVSFPHSECLWSWSSSYNS